MYITRKILIEYSLHRKVREDRSFIPTNSICSSVSATGFLANLFAAYPFYSRGTDA